MVASPEVPFVHGMDFRVGVDTASGAARNAAATGAPSTVPGAGGSTISFFMEQVDTVEDLMTSLGISAKASGGIGLFSASARFNFAQSCKVHSSSVFLIVSVQVTEAFQSIAQPGIDPGAADLLANAKMDRFREEFGDMFVRGILSGGQFFGVVEVLTRDQSDARTISAGLSASYAAFGASGTFDKAFSDTVSSHRTKVTCFVEGGQNRQLPTTVTAMTDRAINFPNELAGNAVPYLALLDDYGVLPLPQPPNFIDLQQQKDVLAECARLRNLHQQWLNELDYIGGHADEFVNPDNAQLDQLRTDINSDLNVIAAAASQAINEPKSAQLPVGLRVTAPQFPARVAVSSDGLPLAIAAAPGSMAEFPRLLRDVVPDSYQATITLNAAFGDSAIESVRHAGFALLNTATNRYSGLSKRVDAKGTRVGQVSGTLGATSLDPDDSDVPDNFGPRDYPFDTVHLRISVIKSTVVDVELSADGVQFVSLLGPHGGGFGSGFVPPPTKLMLFAFSQGDTGFVAHFSEPVVSAPETDVG
ncbi:hypothetical protein ABZ299_16955 [Streptomyces sp. NPDC006184]|uniref:hypothetical protein n=1 Tax=Streptomyces sp. NPDC006184 TaxID=3155455 RepID=UPI00339EC2BC